MDALILSAGLGSRLGRLTADSPKPMLTIGGKPLLDINLDKVISLNVERIFINTHYKSEVIINFINGRKDLKNKVVLLHEPKLLGTAGTVQNLLNLYQISDLIVMHGDNFFEDDLKNMLEVFMSLPSFFWGLAGYFRTNDPKSFGIFELDANDTVTAFHEKKVDSVGRNANSAIYMFNRNGLKNFIGLKTEQSDISINILPRLIGRIKAIKLNGTFIDIGTPENLQKANNSLNRKIN
jgi:mannose-1-phosphate guanylyltransferase